CVGRRRAWVGGVRACVAGGGCVGRVTRSRAGGASDAEKMSIEPRSCMPLLRIRRRHVPAQGALPVPTPLAANRTGPEWRSGLAATTAGTAGTAATAGSTSLLPIIVLFLFLQRFFVEGVAGAVTQ
ncbi:MAG: hypothetical protein ACRDP8_16100, partial [Actinopolymorphaceae bacterium]